MRALLQRVSHAQVVVAGQSVGQCGAGLLILVCAMPGDSAETGRTLAAKISKLRLFKDGDGKMNLSILQTGGSALVVSQFTLAADTSRGNRPGFSGAAKPDEAETLYLHFAQALRELGIATQTGVFGADMDVSLTNDGPVTIWLDTTPPEGTMPITPPVRRSLARPAQTILTRRATGNAQNRASQPAS